MSMSDPIADMLTRIRNAILREHRSVTIPASKIKENIAKVLNSEGFIESYSVLGEGVEKKLTIQLKYDAHRDSVIRKVERISKPGLRIFKGFTDLRPLLNGQGIYIVSTSKGLMSDRQCKENRMGGEVICAVS
ncbi:MAG: 30S ribosomal protein S8 [Proteobacteria bacterium]|nr:30S ribosomal protein S8 [Pseudomonadota bacterium]